MDTSEIHKQVDSLVNASANAARESRAVTPVADKSEFDSLLDGPTRENIGQIKKILSLEGDVSATDWKQATELQRQTEGLLRVHEKARQFLETIGLTPADITSKWEEGVLILTPKDLQGYPVNRWSNEHSVSARVRFSARFKPTFQDQFRLDRRDTSYLSPKFICSAVIKRELGEVDSDEGIKWDSHSQVHIYDSTFETVPGVSSSRVVTINYGSDEDARDGNYHSIILFGGSKPDSLGINFVKLNGQDLEYPQVKDGVPELGIPPYGSDGGSIRWTNSMKNFMVGRPGTGIIDLVRVPRVEVKAEL